MRVRLIVVDGAKTGELALRLPTVIGRGRSAGLKLPSSVVSRQHSEVYAYEEQIAIRDLGSSNGTIVNGHRVDGPTFITPEDLVKIGPVSFHLVSESTVSNGPTAMEARPGEDAVEDTPATVSSEPTEQEATVGRSSEETDSPKSDDSVLKYSESTSASEPSFVGIDVAEKEAQGSTPKNHPHIPIAGSRESGVEDDDSSLKNFLDQLGG